MILILYQANYLNWIKNEIQHIKKGIKDQITQKQVEIDALTMPIAVTNPNDNPEFSKENEEVVRKIEQIVTDVNLFEAQIEGCQNRKNKSTQ